MAVGNLRVRHERSHQNTGAPILRALVLRAQDSREDVRDGRGVARACVLGRRCCGSAQFCAGRRVRIRAYRDLRRLSPSHAGAVAPPTPAVCSLCVNPVGPARVRSGHGQQSGTARRRFASLEVLCERCAVHGAARSAAPEASTAARRRMRVRTIAGLEVERVSGGALGVRVAGPRDGGRVCIVFTSGRFSRCAQ